MNESTVSYSNIFINKKQNDYLRAIYFISIFVLTGEKKRWQT